MLIMNNECISKGFHPNKLKHTYTHKPDLAFSILSHFFFLLKIRIEDQNITTFYRADCFFPKVEQG